MEEVKKGADMKGRSLTSPVWEANSRTEETGTAL